MMCVFELFMVLVIVVVLVVVVGIVMFGSGYVERLLVIGKDICQVYDVLNNFCCFGDYVEFIGSDLMIKYDFLGKVYGFGVEISWIGVLKKVGSGKLIIVSVIFEFNKIDFFVNFVEIVWNFDGDWCGSDKYFMLDLECEGCMYKLIKVIWVYDVKYGFNLLNCYFNFYIYGVLDVFIQYSLIGLQNMFVLVKNVDYSELVFYIEQIKLMLVLLVLIKIECEGGFDVLIEVIDGVVKLLQDIVKKFNVNVIGLCIFVVNNYGDQIFIFDIVLLIDVIMFMVVGQSYDFIVVIMLIQLGVLVVVGFIVVLVSVVLIEVLVDVVVVNVLGSIDKYGCLIIDQDVCVIMMVGGVVLKGEWNGIYVGVLQICDEFEVYVQIYGYKYDIVVNCFYDVLVCLEQIDINNNIIQYVWYDVYLLLSDVLEQMLEQEVGIQLLMLDELLVVFFSSVVLVVVGFVVVLVEVVSVGN